jgi:hypothetical protein
MQGDEIRALRRLQREQGPSSHVFMTERDGPMTPKAFHALFGRIGARAKMRFPIHPHMLRQTLKGGVVFRWWNGNIGDHFYTTDASGELAPSSGYQPEGITGYVLPGP